MLCPTCRDLIPEDSAFCPSCLADLEDERDPVPTRPSTRKAVAAPRRPPAPAVEPTSFEERFPDAQPCPTHPQMPLVGTCARCGRFTCVRCAPEVVDRPSAACLSCQPQQLTAETGEGIGGWLYLLAMVLVLTALSWPLMVILIVAGGALAATHSLTLAVMLLLALAMSVLGGFTVVQFFACRRTAPGLIIAFLVANFLVEGVQIALAEHSTRSVFSAGGSMALWTAYLILSDRAKRTFVR